MQHDKLCPGVQSKRVSTMRKLFQQKSKLQNASELFQDEQKKKCFIMDDSSMEDYLSNSCTPKSSNFFIGRHLSGSQVVRKVQMNKVNNLIFCDNPKMKKSSHSAKSVQIQPLHLSPLKSNKEFVLRMRRKYQNINKILNEKPKKSEINIFQLSEFWKSDILIQSDSARNRSQVIQQMKKKINLRNFRVLSQKQINK